MQSKEGVTRSSLAWPTVFTDGRTDGRTSGRAALEGEFDDDRVSRIN